jgi:hypothetical protein
MESLNNKWLLLLEVLKDYIEKENRIPTKPILHSYKGKDYNIGYWVVHQRRLNRNDTLMEDRRKHLDNLNGGILGVNEYLLFGTHLECLKDFVNKNNKLPITGETHFYNGKTHKIGTFVNNQKLSLKINTLSNCRKKELLLVDKNFFKELKRKKSFQENCDDLEYYIETKNKLPQRKDSVITFNNIEFNVYNFFNFNRNTDKLNDKKKQQFDKIHKYILKQKEIKLQKRLNNQSK